MVFQSAMSSLNPVTRVEDQFVDMFRAHQKISKRFATMKAAELLDVVGIDRERLRSYPHELSGGMRQRVVIAMAMALGPELLLLDEPTTALDVIVQREILQQLQEFQREMGFAVLFITHDLSLLVEFSDRIAIMYSGDIVEEAAADELFARPAHPYTAGLMASFPPLTGEQKVMTGIPGNPPDLQDPPPGCRFHPRCPAGAAAAVSRRDAGTPSAGQSAHQSPATSPWSRRERRKRLATRARSASAVSLVLRRDGLLGRAPDAACGGRREPLPQARSRLGARGRERERQEHRRSAARPAVPADVGLDPAREPGRHGHQRPSPVAQVPLPGAVDLPGPVRVAEPRQAGGPPPRPSAANPPCRPRRPGPGARPAPPRDGRPRARRRRGAESTRTSCRAVSASAWRSPARLPSSRRSCSRTSRSRCSTCRSGSGS